jgi:predicted MFS family arabinose efflux permease
VRWWGSTSTYSHFEFSRSAHANSATINSYPIVFYNLIDSIGFGWTVRTLGFIALGTLLVPVCFLRMRVKPAKPRALLDWSAFADWPFAIFVFCAMLGFLGQYVMLFFISYFSEATHIASEKMAFYLIPIVNAGSVFGRTIPNAISDYTGPISSEFPIMLILSSAYLHYSVYPCCYCLRYLDF